MIKIRTEKMVILGLSDHNMQLLAADRPIKFNLEELGLGNIDLIIFNGRDEESMYQMFKDTIDPEKTDFIDKRKP